MPLSEKKDIAPLIMWIILFVGIVICGGIRIYRLFKISYEYPMYLDIVFVILYLLWMITELRITRKDVNTEGKKTFDLMTCQLYGMGQALTILSALYFPSVWQNTNAIHFTGLSLFFIAVCYRLWAIQTLGQYYSHRVRTLSQHQIVTSGPYKFIRHPAYLGMIVANIGISVYFLNWATFSIFLLILVPAIILRIVIEEKILFKIKGYTEFAKKRKRLIPAIW